MLGRRQDPPTFLGQALHRNAAANAADAFPLSVTFERDMVLSLARLVACTGAPPASRIRMNLRQPTPPFREAAYWTASACNADSGARDVLVLATSGMDMLMWFWTLLATQRPITCVQNATQAEATKKQPALPPPQLHKEQRAHQHSLGPLLITGALSVVIFARAAEVTRTDVLSQRAIRLDWASSIMIVLIGVASAAWHSRSRILQHRTPIRP